MRYIFTICVICCILAPYVVDAQEPARVSVPGGRVMVDGNEPPAPRLLDPVEHKKRVFVDEQKRLYVSLSAPLFLRLALSPVDNDPSYLVHGLGDSEVALPFYLDGPGRQLNEAVDTMSGLDRLVYAVNSDPEQPFTQAVQFDRAGDYTIVIRASDHVDNSENQILRFSIQ